MELAHPNRRGLTAFPSNGVLRAAQPISPLELLPAFRSGAPLVIMKSPLVSTVHRSARYDCITVVEPSHGAIQGRVHVFLGLITTGGDAAMARVPLVRQRIAAVIARSGVRPNSHSARQLLAALRTVPRDELLEADEVDLLRVARLVMDRAQDGGVGVFDRLHLNLDFVTVIVYFPADRFGPETRRNVADLVEEYWPGAIVGREDRLVEMGLARMAFLVSVRPGAAPQPDVAGPKWCQQLAGTPSWYSHQSPRCFRSPSQLFQTRCRIGYAGLAGYTLTDWSFQDGPAPRLSVRRRATDPAS